MNFKITDNKILPYINKNDDSTDIKKISNVSSKTFSELFENELNKKIKISKHALERLESNPLKKEDIDILNKGIELLEKKGAINSVLLYKDMVLIASIKNKTIITAINNYRAKDNIFTNIDSVIIL